MNKRYFSRLVLVTVLFFCASLQAKSLKDIDTVTMHYDCFSNVFESYDSWLKFLSDRNAKFSKKRFPFTEASFNNFKAKLTCTVFEYKVDDVIVGGFLIHPKSVDKALPTVIYNRGGNGGWGSVNMGRMMYELMPLSIEGFAVIGSQYRWEGDVKAKDFKTNGKSDEFGGIDQNDVNALLPIIEQLAVTDRKRIGVLGSSRGGMQSYLFAKANPDIKALVSKSGIADLFSFRDRDEKTATLLSTVIPNYQQEEETLLKARSAIHWSDELPKVPILLIHAKDDDKVRYADSQKLAEQLEALGRPYLFASFDDGGHELTKYKAEIDAMILDWFSTHL